MTKKTSLYIRESNTFSLSLFTNTDHTHTPDINYDDIISIASQMCLPLLPRRILLIVFTTFLPLFSASSTSTSSSLLSHFHPRRFDEKRCLPKALSVFLEPPPYPNHSSLVLLLLNLSILSAVSLSLLSVCLSSSESQYQ